MTEVLSIPAQPDGSSLFGSHPLHRSTSQTSFLLQSPAAYSKSSSNLKSRCENTRSENRLPTSLPSSAPSSPCLPPSAFSSQPSYTSTPSSNLSLDELYSGEDEEAELIFPSYDDDGSAEDEPGYSSVLEPSSGLELISAKTIIPSASDSSLATPYSFTSDRRVTAGDDIAVRPEPTKHVDYLSHKWREEDVWSSWRHIVAKRKFYNNSPRLENASWRSWTKSKYQLRTILPEQLNWMKDHDVTWLYGPLQTSSIQFFSSDTAPPASQLSRCNSFSSKKTILKKRSLSELMLQRSLSSSTLVKQATDALRAQQPVTNLHVSSADGNEARSNPTKSNPEKIDLKTITGPPTPIPSVSTSGMQTPRTKRHIHFNNKVEQCIAINKSSGHEDYYSAIHDDSSDEDLLMMKPVHNSKTKRSHHSTPRNSFSGESKTIAMLPSTTLNYRGDTPDPILQEIKQNAVGRKAAPRNSPPIPQEIFRPTPQNTNNSVPSREGRTLTTPPTNFLLDEEDEEFDMEWQPSPLRREGIYVHKREEADYGSHDEQNDGLRQTPSGMFMPYDDDEGGFAARGLIGRVFDTVNTAKDIAHVIWNVGWRK